MPVGSINSLVFKLAIDSATAIDTLKQLEKLTKKYVKMLRNGTNTTQEFVDGVNQNIRVINSFRNNLLSGKGSIDGFFKGLSTNAETSSRSISGLRANLVALNRELENENRGSKTFIDLKSRIAAVNTELQKELQLLKEQKNAALIAAGVKKQPQAPTKATPTAGSIGEIEAQINKLRNLKKELPLLDAASNKMSASYLQASEDLNNLLERQNLIKEKDKAQLAARKGGISNEAQRLEILRSKIAEARLEMNLLTAASQQNSTQFSQASKKVDDYTKEAKGLEEQLKKLRKQDAVGADKSKPGFFSRFGRIFTATAEATASFQVLALLRAAIEKTIQSIVEFERELKQLQAVANASSNELLKLSQNALDIAANTRFSAIEIANLQTELAKLGFNPSEILDSTRAITNLAIATGEDLVKSGEVAANVLRGLGLSALETNRVVDVMTSSFNQSALDLTKFRNSIKYITPIARSVGVDIEGIAAALSILADRGIAGSQAGTGLRRILSDLGTEGSKATKVIGFTVKSTDDFVRALEVLSKKNLDVGSSFRLFGRYAQSAILGLTQNYKAVEQLTAIYREAEGSSEALAKVQRDSLYSVFKELASAAEALAIALGDYLLPTLKNIVAGFRDFVSAAKEWLGISLEDKLDTERLKLQGLVGAATKYTTGTRERSSAIKELIAFYPEYFRGLKEEELTNEKLLSILQLANLEYREKIRLQRQDTAAQRANEKIIRSYEKENKAIEELLNTLDEMQKRLDDSGNTLVGGGNLVDNFLKKYTATSDANLAIDEAEAQYRASIGALSGLTTWYSNRLELSKVNIEKAEAKMIDGYISLIRSSKAKGDELEKQMKTNRDKLLEEPAGRVNDFILLENEINQYEFFATRISELEAKLNLDAIAANKAPEDINFIPEAARDELQGVVAERTAFVGKTIKFLEQEIDKINALGNKFTAADSKYLQELKSFLDRLKQQGGIIEEATEGSDPSSIGQSLGAANKESEDTKINRKISEIKKRITAAIKDEKFTDAETLAQSLKQFGAKAELAYEEALRDIFDGRLRFIEKMRDLELLEAEDVFLRSSRNIKDIEVFEKQKLAINNKYNNEKIELLKKSYKTEETEQKKLQVANLKAEIEAEEERLSRLASNEKEQLEIKLQYTTTLAETEADLKEEVDLIKAKYDTFQKLRLLEIDRANKTAELKKLLFTDEQIEEYFNSLKAKIEKDGKKALTEAEKALRKALFENTLETDPNGNIIDKEALLEAQKQLREAQQAYETEANKTFLLKQLEAGEISREQYERFLKASEADVANTYKRLIEDIIENQIGLLEAKLKILGESDFGTKDPEGIELAKRYEEQIVKLRTEIAKLKGEEFDIKVGLDEESVRQLTETISSILSYLQDFVSSLFDLFDLETQRRLALIEASLRDIDARLKDKEEGLDRYWEKMRRRIEFAEDADRESLIRQAENYSNSINEQIDAEIAKREYLEAKKKALDKEAFERSKRMQIAEAQIKMSLAILNAIATVRDPLLQGIAIALAVSTSAIQIAKIMATEFSGEMGGALLSILNKQDSIAMQRANKGYGFGQNIPNNLFKIGGSLKDGLKVVDGGNVPDNGMITGRRHNANNAAKSGVKAVTQNGTMVEFEGGEITTMNGKVRQIFTRKVAQNPFLKKAALGTASNTFDPKKFLLASTINSTAGGIDFAGGIARNRSLFSNGGGLGAYTTPRLFSEGGVPLFTATTSNNSGNGDAMSGVLKELMMAMKGMGNTMQANANAIERLDSAITNMRVEIGLSEVKSALKKSDSIVRNASTLNTN